MGEVMDRLAVRYPFAEPPAGDRAVEVAKGVLWLRLPRLPCASPPSWRAQECGPVCHQQTPGRLLKGRWAELEELRPGLDQRA
jgi:hypothetical protein